MLSSGEAAGFSSAAEPSVASELSAAELQQQNAELRQRNAELQQQNDELNEALRRLRQPDSAQEPRLFRQPDSAPELRLLCQQDSAQEPTAAAASAQEPTAAAASAQGPAQSKKALASKLPSKIKPVEAADERVEEFKSRCRQTEGGKRIIRELEAYGEKYGVDIFKTGLGRTASKQDVPGARLEIDWAFPPVGACNCCVGLVCCHGVLTILVRDWCYLPQVTTKENSLELSEERDRFDNGCINFVFNLAPEEAVLEGIITQKEADVFKTRLESSER